MNKENKYFKLINWLNIILNRIVKIASYPVILKLFSFLQRSACHIQVFAMSRWLAVTLPVEYYELARGLEWSIPYFSLPWESGYVQSVMVGSSSPGSSQSFILRTYDRGLSKGIQPKEENMKAAAPVNVSPLTPMEYRSFFEVRNHFLI